MKNRLVPISIIAMLVLGAVAYVLWPHGEPSIDPQRLANQFAAGKSFSLPGGGKIEASSPAASYFALPSGPQRLAFLDHMIDEQELTRKKIASGEIKLPPGVSAGPHGPPDAAEGANPRTSITESSSPDGSQKEVTIRLNADDLSPDFRAQMEEFHAALSNRRRERGLDPDAPMMIIKSEVRTSPEPNGTK